MAGDIGIDIHVDTAQLSRLMRRLATYYGEPKGFYGIFAEWYFGEMKSTYGSRGSNIGVRWGDLSDRYLEMKKKQGYPATIHVMTGRTKKALTGGRGGGRRIRKSKKRMEIRIGQYPGFYDRKHQTTHPFYIIDNYRPLQHKAPTKQQQNALDERIQADIDKMDRRVTR